MRHEAGTHPAAAVRSWRHALQVRNGARKGDALVELRLLRRTAAAACTLSAGAASNNGAAGAELRGPKPDS